MADIVIGDGRKDPWVSERGRTAGTYRRSTSFDVTGLDPVFIQDVTKDVFFTALNQEQGIGNLQNPRYVTDRVFDKSPANVLPFGRIEAVERVDVREVVAFILKELRARSRQHYRTGNFHRSHTVLINGFQASTNRLKDIKDNEEVQIINSAFYSIYLEHMFKIYNQVLRRAIRVYGRLVFFKERVQYREISPQVHVWRPASRGRRRRLVAQRYPMIVFATHPQGKGVITNG